MAESKVKRLGRFDSRGLGSKYGQQPISVMYPADIDVLLRSLPNRSEYIRDAVIEKLMRDGLLLSDRDSTAVEAIKPHAQKN